MKAVLVFIDGTICDRTAQLDLIGSHAFYERDAIMKKYGKAAPTAGQGQAAGQGARGAGRGTAARLTTKQRAAMQAELAKWRVDRDKLFTKYGITARSQGRNA